VERETGRSRSVWPGRDRAESGALGTSYRGSH
jgi:hypothetical protein